MSSGTLRRSRFAHDATNGFDDRKMSTAMKQDASGSQPAHPHQLVNTVETITDTLPKVSARMWR